MKVGYPLDKRMKNIHEDQYSLSREIGARIKKEREKFNITQEKLSELTGIAEKYFYSIEKGNINTSAQNLLLIANALGLTLDYLIAGEQEDDKIKKIPAFMHSLNEDEFDKIMRMALVAKESFFQK